MTKQQREKRDGYIMKMREEGKEINEISSIFGISRQRVHQIINAINKHKSELSTGK